MKEDTELKETTSRRQFTKAAVIAAVAAPIAALLASCTKQPPQAGEATPSATPTPTEEKHKEGDGSPITVGGGGGKREKEKPDEPNVSVKFKGDDYPEESGNAGTKEKHKNKNGWKIKTFKIRSKGKWTDYSKELHPNGACSIVIQCEGDNTDVTIDGDAFGVGFDTKTYVKVSDGYYRNPNAGQHIKRVTLTVTGILKPPVDEFFNEADQCFVCADFVKPDKSMCGPTPTPTP